MNAGKQFARKMFCKFGQTSGNLFVAVRHDVFMCAKHYNENICAQTVPVLTNRTQQQNIFFLNQVMTDS